MPNFHFLAVQILWLQGFLVSATVFSCESTFGPSETHASYVPVGNFDTRKATFQSEALGIDSHRLQFMRDTADLP